MGPTGRSLAGLWHRCVLCSLALNKHCTVLNFSAVLGGCRAGIKVVADKCLMVEHRAACKSSSL